MDLYSSMPQVKTAASTSSVYTASPHVLDQSELSNQSLARSDVTKYNSDILTSSAWSAVIHHPAEDSEPDELPSTVDIDAIKEPATPLPGGACTPGGQQPTDDDEDDDDDDSESESDDPDSDSESGNESNTESEGSRGSWSESDSDSAESDASSVRGRLATPKTSSSSEAEEEQDGGGGGRRKHADKDLGSEHYYRSRQTDPSNPMKVKISALKFTSKHKSTSKSQIAAATATDSSSEDNGRGGEGEEEDSSADERRWKEDDDNEEEEESEEEKKADDTKRTSISGIPSPTKQTSKSAIERNKYSSLQSDRESLRSAAAAFHRRPAPSNRNSYHGSSNSDSSRTGSSSTHRDSPGKIEDSRIITNSDHSSSSDFSRTGSYRDSPCKIDDSRSSKSSYHVGNSDLNRTGVSRTSSLRDSPTKSKIQGTLRAVIMLVTVI
ncbi:hypothetical protein LSTR_LSTR007879 [Laodelphax striatellus]|uniref:Uncharacterized protein n=1 Tax=Laodelphax striatellus TaxID=195883 RepID=A0A482XPR0_LAOST|nr:hypothetical protein LSTR_LSTR007879 [Laodelphax striatellus]